MDLSATASAVFVKYILFVEKCLKAFLIHLFYFVYFSEKWTPPKVIIGTKQV